ncbi:hypothetical protein E4T38_04701 [Aureobasidium subglaciale]|nr:hypothetical protein E4T38_04701 [Aureobasidium subglaciale]KAI5223163.1 hypothetical protein E4T40_04701 [Aureobasidium subglaciale]KAI5226768.1 hypothetical protein E4T41_04644 [Aureobasidium subglaciale]KAI5262460.1 hypothetical protein E4T46_04530 [Aureobasidium subglaciale]
MSRRDQSWPVWLLLELSTDQSLFSQGCSECSFYALRYSVSRSCAERFRGEGSGDRRIAKDGIEVCSVSVELCACSQEVDTVGDAEKRRIEKIMFQRVALTLYDTANVHPCIGEDDETTLSCKYRKAPYFSFFESRDGRRWGL